MREILLAALLTVVPSPASTTNCFPLKAAERTLAEQHGEALFARGFGYDVQRRIVEVRFYRTAFAEDTGIADGWTSVLVWRERDVMCIIAAGFGLGMIEWQNPTPVGRKS